jgi:hypothetical protein
MEERAMMREIELARGRLRLGVGDGDEGAVAGTGGSAGAVDGGIASSLGQMAPTTSTTSSAAAGGGASSSSRPKKKSRFDQALFIKFSKPVHSEYVSLPWICLHDDSSRSQCYLSSFIFLNLPLF